MHKLTHNQFKKTAATISVVVIGVALIFNQGSVENIFKIKTANAQVFGGNEHEVLGDITSASCSSAANQSNMDTAISDDREYAFVWEDDACDGGGNGTGIYMERYDTLNGPNPATGGPVSVSNVIAGDQKDPSIAMDHEGNYVVAWDGNGTEDADGIYIRAFRSDGTPITNQILVNTQTSGVQSNPKVAIEFGENIAEGGTAHVAVVWQGDGPGDTSGIYMQRYHTDFLEALSPDGSNVLVNTFTAGPQIEPDVALNNFNEATVVWRGPGTGFPSSNEVWIQGYDSSNNPWGGTPNNIRINSTTTTSKPAIAADKSSEPSSNTVPGGKFVVVYKAGANNIYGKLIDRCSAGGCPLGNVELNISTGNSDYPDVSMDYLGNFTVTWQQDDLEVRGINYDYLGHRIDTDFRVNQLIMSTTGSPLKPAVAKDKDGEYFVGWTITGPTDTDAKYRGFGTDIFKNGAEKLANTATSFGYSENQVSTAIAPNGNHVMAYIGEDTNTSTPNVFFSLYDAQGNPIVENQLAGSTDNPVSKQPDVAFFKDTQGTGVGRFVIVWDGLDPTSVNSGSQVLYREFDATGTPATGSEQLVNPTTDEDYQGIRVSAGYYNDGSSSVIDRFAIIYEENIAEPPQTNYNSAYHTESGFNLDTLENCRFSFNCFAYTSGTGVDIYPDINGNDKIIYTWDKQTIPSSVNYYIQGQEANGGTPVGSPFQIATSVETPISQPDVAFISPTQYVATWTACDTDDCNAPGILASRFTGDFSGSAPTAIDTNIPVYPGSGDSSENFYPRIAGDTNNGSFLIVWTKSLNFSSYNETEGKFFESSPSLSNFGVGFVINSTQSGNQIAPDVSMNNNGLASVSWEGEYGNFTGIAIDDYGADFQMLNNPTFIQTLPELPTSAQLSITQGGKTLTIPSSIEFPSITANTMNPTDVEREIDENPAAGQPLYFQLEDLGGNSGTCTPGPCYSVTISSSDFTYTDIASGQTYTIPASDVFLKNYDGNHPGVAGAGACGSPDASLSFNTIFGNSADFNLDPTTCDYTPLDTNQTILNKISNTSDTGKIQWFPKLKISVPALTPPGTYTGTITITSA